MSFLKDFQSEIKTLLVVALVAAILAVGGILLLKATQFVPVVQPPPPALSSQPLDTSDFTLSEVEGWQTYRNDEFEVKYPAKSSLPCTVLNECEGLVLGGAAPHRAEGSGVGSTFRFTPTTQ